MPVLLIDAYNVLHVVGVLPPELAGPDLAGLGALIERSRFRRDPAILFCDGRAPVPRPELPRGIRAKWSGPDRPADDLIIAQIRTTTTPRRCLVVTSDRQILKEAQRRRCEIMRSEAFMAILARDAAAPTAVPRPNIPLHLPPDALPRWLQDEAVRLSKQTRPPGSGPPALWPGAPWDEPAEPAEPDESDGVSVDADADLGTDQNLKKGSEAGDRTPVSPGRRPDPLFPADILTEAAALLEQPADVSAEEHPDAGDSIDAPSDVNHAEPSKPPRPTDPLLSAFAEAMREAGAAISRHRTRGRRADSEDRETDRTPSPRDGMPRTPRTSMPPLPPPRARSPILPSDILAEAEHLLAEAEADRQRDQLRRTPSEDSPKPPSESPPDLP